MCRLRYAYPLCYICSLATFNVFYIHWITYVLEKRAASGFNTYLARSVECFSVLWVCHSPISANANRPIWGNVCASLTCWLINMISIGKIYVSNCYKTGLLFGFVEVKSRIIRFLLFFLLLSIGYRLVLCITMVECPLEVLLQVLQILQFPILRWDLCFSVYILVSNSFVTCPIHLVYCILDTS